MVSGAGNTATQQLSMLFQQAKVPGKGIQILDATTDASGSKKIRLKPDEVQDLLAHVEKLPAADKKNAIDTLGYFKDKFDISDAAAKKLFDDMVPASAVAPAAGGRVRSVREQQAAAKSAQTIATPKEIKDTDAALGGIRQAAGDTVADEANGARSQAVKDGGVRPAPDGGRRAWVESQAANPPPPPAPPDPAMGIFEQYAKSPFFEDRLMAALGKAGLKFMKDMNKKLESFDDPNREALLRNTIKNDITQMTNMANAVSPAGKARIAEQIQKFVSSGQAVADPTLKAWLDQVPKAEAGKAQTVDDILKTLPPANNSVIEAMLKSDKPDVRGWGAVFQASDGAEQLKSMMKDRDPMNMSEDDCRGLVAKGHEFQSELHGLKQFLPPDLAQQVGDIKIDDLPKAIDPTSRQVMFQQINLMMNQYQQIMQAFSEIINKMNEMAMDPIRKIGR